MAFEKEGFPEGWVRAIIDQIGIVVTGNTPSKKQASFYGNYIPFFKPTDLNFGYCVTNSAERLSKKGLLKVRLIPKKTIMVTSIGTIGKVGFSRVEGTTNQQINSIIPNLNIILPEYLYFVCISPQFQKSLLTSSSSTTLPIINKSRFSKLSTPVPSLPEQHRIVTKIESIFAQIDAAKQQLERLASQVTSSSGSLAQLKSSVLKQAFDGNLTSQDSDNKYDANEWIVAKLEDITLFSKNGFTGRPNENNSGIPRLGIETITNSNSVFINTSKCKFIDIPSHRLDNYLVQKNDLFFCRQNGNKNYVGKCCIFIDNVRDTIFSDSLILFRIDCDKIYPNYLAYFVNSASGRNQIERYCSTTAGNYSINGTNLKKILIKFPAITEQKKIVAKLESIFGNIDTLNLFCFILRGNLFTNLRYFMILYMLHLMSEQ